MGQITNTHSVKFAHGNANYGYVNCGNITGSFNTTTMSDEDAQVMRWLTPVEPGNRHDGVRTTRFEGVGDWLFEISQFQEWREGDGDADKAVLFCSGNPGVGKTYLW